MAWLNTFSNVDFSLLLLKQKQLTIVQFSTIFSLKKVRGIENNNMGMALKKISIYPSKWARNCWALIYRFDNISLSLSPSLKNVLNYLIIELASPKAEKTISFSLLLNLPLFTALRLWLCSRLYRQTIQNATDDRRWQWKLKCFSRHTYNRMLIELHAKCGFNWIFLHSDAYAMADIEQL